MAKYYKWNFDKIVIYPFGGCTKFDEKINRPMKEELLILISGPSIQIILFLIIIVLSKYEILTYRNYLLFKNYHYTLLLFNLLPIYPLDGGRIMNIIMNYFLPFKKGNKIVILISIVFIISIMFLYRNLNFTLMGVLLLSEIILYFKRQNFLYNRLLLERYMYSIKFNRVKVIDRKHVILYNGKYITEKDYLSKRFR